MSSRVRKPRSLLTIHSVAQKVDKNANQTQVRFAGISRWVYCMVVRSMLRADRKNRSVSQPFHLRELKITNDRVKRGEFHRRYLQVGMTVGVTSAVAMAVSVSVSMVVFDREE